MTFKEYQKLAQQTALYPEKDSNFNYRVTYPSLGLVGEAGEVAEKIKKIFREDQGIIDEDKRRELSKELGDVLWYIAQLASELKLSLEDIAAANVDKLSSRKARGKIHGSGDNR